MKIKIIYANVIHVHLYICLVTAVFCEFAPNIVIFIRYIFKSPSCWRHNAGTGRTDGRTADIQTGIMQYSSSKRLSVDVPLKYIIAIF